MQPETKYAKGEEGYVGYQVFGEGPRDLIFMPSWFQNLDAMWDEPSLARYFDRLASFARVICFDRRGHGVSDPVPLASLPTLERWMDDARLVLDEVGSDQTTILGEAEGGPMAMLFAATYPRRAPGLILVNSFARWQRDDDYAIGMPPETVDKLVSQYEQSWGSDHEILRLTAPSVANDKRFQRWFKRYSRLCMGKGAAAAMYNWVLHLDVRAVLPSIQADTLVIHRTETRHHRVEFGRYLAEHIPGARLVELPGADSFPFHAGDPEPILDQVREFVTGEREVRVEERVLATILMTDIVGSTKRAAELGDERWLDLLQAQLGMLRDRVQRFRGREIGTTGDGFLAIFDGPARAVRCAEEIEADARELNLKLRVGLHTGEIELRDDQIGGIAVHIAARVMEQGADGGVFVSGTVKDLVVGSGIEFDGRGQHALKGVPGEWPIFAVTSARSSA